MFSTLANAASTCDCIKQPEAHADFAVFLLQPTFMVIGRWFEQRSFAGQSR